MDKVRADVAANRTAITNVGSRVDELSKRTRSEVKSIRQQAARDLDDTRSTLQMLAILPLLTSGGKTTALHPGGRSPTNVTVATPPSTTTEILPLPQRRSGRGEPARDDHRHEPGARDRCDVRVGDRGRCHSRQRGDSNHGDHAEGESRSRRRDGSHARRKHNPGAVHVSPRSDGDQSRARTTAPLGQFVTISGTDLAGATAVSFGETSRDEPRGQFGAGRSRRKRRIRAPTQQPASM